LQKIYCEKTSGATAERPQLEKLLAKFSAGDVVVRVAQLLAFGDSDGTNPHYSREMRDQSQTVDIVHNYANGLFDEVFCNEISSPGVW